jgi:hypothetical protein
MRKLLLAICFTSVFATMPATAQVSVGFDAPGVNIGINIGTYPQLVPIPVYPVYYAPQLNANYFFYDGMFWVYVGDNWYTSAWYDGPWELVEPLAVPLYILRVPVHYYRRPPPYFRTWVASAPPHWGEHWGRSWEERRRGWDRWDRSAVAPPAPLPTYQQRYSGNRYPHIDQQQVLQNQNYRYRPHDAVAQQYYQRLHASAQSGRGQAAAPPQGQPSQPTSPQQAQRGRGQNAAESHARAQQQAQQRQAEQSQRSQQQAQQRQAEQAQRSQQQAQQRQAEQAQRSQQQAQQRQAEQAQRSQQQAQQRQAEQAQHSQQQAQQRQVEQAQRSQQQAQQRQAEQAQRSQQQAQQRQAEQAQRSQQQAQQRQAEQAQRSQQQAQQRQAEQAQRSQQQAQQQQRGQRVPQARGEEPKEQRGG